MMDARTHGRTDTLLKVRAQPKWLETGCEQLNVFFTVVFALEMVFKLVALGLLDYVRDGWNLFDAFRP